MGNKSLVCELCGSAINIIPRCKVNTCSNPSCLAQYEKTASGWVFSMQSLFCHDCHSVTQKYDDETYICPKCGGFYKIDAITDEWFFERNHSTVCYNCGEKMQMDSLDYMKCPRCGVCAEFYGNDWSFVTDDYDQLYSDKRPRECTGCGSDMYPDCRCSCKLFDD